MTRFVWIIFLLLLAAPGYAETPFPTPASAPPKAPMKSTDIQGDMLRADYLQQNCDEYRQFAVKYNEEYDKLKKENNSDADRVHSLIIYNAIRYELCGLTKTTMKSGLRVYELENTVEALQKQLEALNGQVKK